MNNSHIIIGYGNWAKKIIHFLEKKKIYSKLYIKTRSNYFQYSKNRKLTKKKFASIKENIKSVHICSPVNSHFYYLKKFSYLKKIIIEKPFLKNISQLNKIKKIFNYKNLILINYTYLFNPILKKLKDDIKVKSGGKIVINFSKKNNFYKKKYECINDWIEHPLSIILYLFGKFKKFEILKKEFSKKNRFKEKLVMHYSYKNFIIQVNINVVDDDKKNIIFLTNSKKRIYDLEKNSVFNNNKKIFFSKKNSFDTLYLTLKNNIKLQFQKFDFHKEILKEKIKILKKLKNAKKNYN